MKTLLKTENLKVGYARRQLWVVSFGRLYIFNHPTDAALFFFRTHVRGYFPSFWARGVFCCDTHRVTWRPAFTWFDAQTNVPCIGDGPDIWHRISMRDWLILRKRRMS